MQFGAILTYFFRILTTLFGQLTSNQFWLTKISYRYKNLLEDNCPNNIVKIRKKYVKIAQNGMKLRGRLSHEFAIFDKKICIDLLNALH